MGNEHQPIIILQWISLSKEPIYITTPDELLKYKQQLITKYVQNIIPGRKNVFIDPIDH